MVTRFLKFLRNILLPRSIKFRTIPFGIARGIRMKINFRVHAQHYFGLYERELNPSFRALVKPGDNCFDVGACTGYDALIMAKLSGGAPVVSFECVDFLAAEAKENFAANPFPITLMEGFVGDDTTPNAMLLDDAAEKTFMPDVIKMDIEGFEVAALRGARKILATRKPSWIIEVHGKDKEDGCIEILKQHGYDPQIVNLRTYLKDYRPMEGVRFVTAQGAPKPASQRSEPVAA